MQEMVNFEGLDIKKSKNKRMAHSVKISTLLKNKDLRLTVSTLVLIFLIASAGVSFISDSIFSVGSLNDVLADFFSPIVSVAVSLFVDFTLFAFALFPFALGIYAYALNVVNMQDADINLLFFYYKDRKRYFFAVRCAYCVMLTLLFVLVLSSLIAYLGGEFAETFKAQDDLVRATVLLSLSFLGVVAALVFSILRFCDCFAVMSLSLYDNYSIKRLCRISSLVTKGKRKFVILNAFSSLFWIFVSVLSAGLLAPFAITRLVFSRALLENDILNEYKTNILYNQKFAEVNDGK